MWIFRLALWLFVLGFAAVLLAFGHWGIRSSEFYADAVDRELALDPTLERSDISPCVFCTYRIQRRGSMVEYRFTIVIRRGDQREEVLVSGSRPTALMR